MATINKHYKLTLTAESIGNKALLAMRNTRNRAKVHSVFDHAFYIQTNKNKLLSVIDNRNYLTPTSILIKEFKEDSFKSLDMKEDMKIVLDGNSIASEDNLFVIKFDKSSTWFSPPPPKRKSLTSLGLLSLNLRVLRDVIYTCPNKEGLVPLLEKVETSGPLNLFLKPQEQTLSEKARPFIERLMWGLYWSDYEMVLSNASPMLGLGPGLTPSCDDFLAGLLMSLNLGGKSLLKQRKSEINFFKKVSVDICKEARVKTTIFSQGLLNGARYGEGPDVAVKLICNILTKDENNVAGSTKDLIHMGETSGADIAVGIYYGIRFLISRIETIEGLDEIA